MILNFLGQSIYTTHLVILKNPPRRKDAEMLQDLIAQITIILNNFKLPLMSFLVKKYPAEIPINGQLEIFLPSNTAGNVNDRLRHGKHWK